MGGKVFMYVDINDISKYKRCSKKKYKVWVCMPPAGTCVINKFEQPEVVQQLKGRTYFTYNEVVKIKDENPALFEYLREKAYIVDRNKRFVLSGTQGELWVIDAQKLARTYTFSTGEEINKTTLGSRYSISGLDWQQLETRGADSGLTYACFVPKEQSLQIQTAWGSTLRCNAPCVSHGKGDFIVCAGNADGSPNLGDRWVVNGLIFGDTYDNRGWSSNLHSSGNDLSDVKKPDFSLLPKRYPDSEMLKKITNDILKDDGYYWTFYSYFNGKDTGCFEEMMAGYIDCPPERFEEYIAQRFGTDCKKFMNVFDDTLSDRFLDDSFEETFVAYLPLTQTLYKELIGANPLESEGVSVSLSTLKVYDNCERAMGIASCDERYVSADTYEPIILYYGGNGIASEKIGVVIRLSIKPGVNYIKVDKGVLVLEGSKLTITKKAGMKKRTKPIILLDAEYRA